MKGRSEQSPGITSKLADRMAGSLLSLCTSATCVGMESRSIRGIPGPSDNTKSYTGKVALFGGLYVPDLQGYAFTAAEIKAMVDGIRYDAGGAVIAKLLAAQIKNDVATVHGIEMRPSDIARQTIYDNRDVYTGKVALLGGEYVASDEAYMYPADTMQAFFDGIEPDSGAVILDALEEGERQKHSLLFFQGGPGKFTQP